MLNPDQQRKTWLLAIIGIVGTFGTWIIHAMWMGKEPPRPQEPED